jgi:hypothetical protein
MTRTKISFLVAAAFALTFTVQGANSASFNGGVFKESAARANLVQKVHRCHFDCRKGRWHGGLGTNRCHRNTWSCAFATFCDPKDCHRH